MSDPNQDEMRRKRLARLAKLEGGPAAASPALEATSPVTDSGGEPSKTIKVSLIIFLSYHITNLPDSVIFFYKT